MKKILILLFLMTLGMSVFAQKSYVTLRVTNLALNVHHCYLTGDVPSDMQKEYDEVPFGDIINQLAEKGFEVEIMTGAGTSNALQLLLSKKKSPDISAIQHTSADDDSEVYEVARYNLQGMPIKKNEKGIQIVVYSNYTTKTIIVE